MSKCTTIIFDRTLSIQSAPKDGFAVANVLASASSRSRTLPVSFLQVGFFFVYGVIGRGDSPNRPRTVAVNRPYQENQHVLVEIAAFDEGL
jgi:hypothetical protein